MKENGTINDFLRYAVCSIYNKNFEYLHLALFYPIDFLSMLKECLKFWSIRQMLKNTALDYELSRKYKTLTFSGMMSTIFWKDFSSDFSFQYNYLIEKIVLFLSM